MRAPTCQRRSIHPWLHHSVLQPATQMLHLPACMRPVCPLPTRLEILSWPQRAVMHIYTTRGALVGEALKYKTLVAIPGCKSNTSTLWPEQAVMHF